MTGDRTQGLMAVDLESEEANEHARTSRVEPESGLQSSMRGRQVGSLRAMMNNQLSVKSLISQMSANPLKEVITPKIEFNDRAWRVAKFDYLFAIIFVAGLFLHFGLGAMIIHQTNTFHNSTGSYLTAEARAQYDSCQLALAEISQSNATQIDDRRRFRRLAVAASATGSDTINDCTTLWCVMDLSNYLTITTMTVAPIVGALWTFALYKLPRGSSWGATLWFPVLYISVAIALFANTEGTTILAALFFAAASVLLLVLFFTREPVHAMGDHLRIATTVLFQNFYIFRAIYLLLMIMCLFLAWHWAVVMRTANVVEFAVHNSCEATTPHHIKAATTYLFFYMVWFVSTCKTGKLVIISMCVGSWFLQQVPVPPRPEMSAFCTVMTTSIGTVAGGSVVTEFVDYLVERNGSRFWWLDPLGFIIRPLKCAFSRCVTPFTRFSIIAHAFTGEGFGPSAYRSTKLLQRNFTNAYVADRILISAVRTGSSALSILIGLIAWMRIDGVNGWNSLSNASDSSGVFGGIGGLLLFVITAVYVVRRPLLGLMLLALFSDTMIVWLSGSVLVFAPFAGVFVACVSAVIINFQGDFVLNTIDTIFMCYAVLKDSNAEVLLTPERIDAQEYVDSLPAVKPEHDRYEDLSSSQSVDSDD